MIVDGTKLGGRYEVEALIGKGAMGTVYRSRHVDVGRAFAIKVLHASLMVEPKIVARFRREAELAGRLRNEHVVSVVDMGLTAHEEQYLVMDYAPGVCLTEIIEAGPLEVTRVLELVRQLCAGLQHAHDAGLIHRDFKPDNVIVENLADGREVARIVDFGVAILREHADDTEGERLTEKGLVVGTPHYMAPEQALGGSCDHRIDLFALGIMMFEMLCGKPPFDGDGVDVASANVHRATPAMRTRAPGIAIDPVIEELVGKLLAKDPEDRLPTARATRDLIDLYLKDRDAAAAELDVDVRPDTGGMPALHQVAAMGRSRTANHSLTPYQHLIRQPVRVETEADLLDEGPVSSPRRRTGAMLALALLVGGLVAVISFVRRDSGSATAPTVVTTSPREPIPAPQAAVPPVLLVPPPAQQIDSDPIVAQATRRPVTGKPKLPAPPASPRIQPAPTSTTAPTASELAALYTRIGRELTTATKRDSASTIDLWPRYRWIRFMDAVKTPAKREAAATILQRLQTDLRALESP